jgi:hypothetical protein
MAVGMVVGVTLLVKAPESILLVLLGVFALSQAGKNLLLKPNLKPIGAVWGGIYCTVGGIFTALYGTGGPIYADYLSRRILEEVKRRATMAALIFLSGFGRLALFLIAGIMLQADLLIFALAALPMSLLGTYAGSFVMTSSNINATIDAAGSAEITLASDGAVTYTAAP